MHGQNHIKYDKYLNSGGDYVEKLWNGGTVPSTPFLLNTKTKSPKYVHCKLIVWLIIHLRYSVHWVLGTVYVATTPTVEVSLYCNSTPQNLGVLINTD